jgi:hypothetical protein
MGPYDPQPTNPMLAMKQLLSYSLLGSQIRMYLLLMLVGEDQQVANFETAHSFAGAQFCVDMFSYGP